MSVYGWGVKCLGQGVSMNVLRVLVGVSGRCVCEMWMYLDAVQRYLWAVCETICGCILGEVCLNVTVSG